MLWTQLPSEVILEVLLCWWVIYAPHYQPFAHNYMLPSTVAIQFLPGLGTSAWDDTITQPTHRYSQAVQENPGTAHGSPLGSTTKCPEGYRYSSRGLAWEPGVSPTHFVSTTPRRSSWPLRGRR